MKRAMFVSAIVMLAATLATFHALAALAPLKWWIARHYAWQIAGVATITFAVLTGVSYRVSLMLPLRHTGRKLTHVDRQLSTSDGVFDGLIRDEEEEER
jgi:hypothetical protein